MQSCIASRPPCNTPRRSDPLEAEVDFDLEYVHQQELNDFNLQHEMAERARDHVLHGGLAMMQCQRPALMESMIWPHTVSSRTLSASPP